MASPFSRTARALGRDSSRGALVLLAATLLALGAWVVWLSTSRVRVVETSRSARLEVLRASHPVDVPAAGRVVEVCFKLGDAVSEGDVLVRLDASAEELELSQARAKAAGIAPELAALKGQIAADAVALATYSRELDVDLAEAQARTREAEIVTRAGRDEAERFRQLLESHVGNGADWSRAKDEADRRAADELAVRTQLEKVRRTWATGSADRRGRVAALEREAARLQADLTTLESALPSLQNAVDRRTIRAPSAGTIGEVGPVRVGSVVAQGEHLATVLARGDLRLVAEFDPAAAFGRLRPGQRARVRLDGFPWTEYGSLQATVTDVAAELHDGQARVELTLDATSASRIPLQHGLPGSVDVTVEESTPLSLVLRAAGKPPS